MIVLSILTALALERVAVSLHDQGAAQASRDRIEEEIAGNLADLRKSEASNEANTLEVRRALAAVLNLLRAGIGDGDKVSRRGTARLQPFQHIFANMGAITPGTAPLQINPPAT